MKIVIVASSPDCNTTDLQTLLQASGLQSARPSAKHGLSGTDWHTKLYKALDQDESGLYTQSPLSVGIAWLELAVDLLVTNLDQTEWGFADSRATWVLDFWRNVDPQSRFVLAYTPPQHVDLSNPQALSTWLSYTGELLRFYKANKARAILVDTSEVGIYPARLSYTCQKTWSLTTVDWRNLGTVAASAPPNTYYPVPPVAAKLGKLLQQSRTPLLNPSTAVMASKKSGKPQGMLGALFALFGKSKQLSEDLDRSQAELSQAKAELDQANLLLSELGKDKDNLQTQAQDLQAQIDRLNAQAEALQAERQALQAQNQTQSQEGELLLSQLHQVQEELERYALQNKQVQAQLAQTAAAETALKTQLDNVTKALEAKSNDLAAKAKELVDAQAAAKNAAQTASAAAQSAGAAAQVAAAKAKQEADAAASAAKAQLDAKAKELADKNNELAAKVKQLADAQGALAASQAAANKAKQEADAAANAAKAQLDAKAKELATAQTTAQAATVDNDALMKDKASLSAERDVLVKDKKTLQTETAALQTQLTTQQRELKQENDLLLLQLHQVQEELEHYFLEHQTLQKATQSQNQRWQRLETRLPSYLDYEEIAPVAIDGSSETPSIDWQITNCTINGQIVPELKFSTSLANGKTMLRVDQQELVPRALDIQNFRSITAADWRRLNTASKAIQYYFSDPATSSKKPEEFDFVFWKQTLLPLAADIQSMPSVFRYTSVQLKRELIHTDYEHLWLVFNDASYGTQTWPKFEMRLSAANIQPGKFSNFPKLEFPRIDGKTQPFDSWFEESWDDFGGKLELRFDVSKQLCDLGVWSKLNASDQALLLSLITLLPTAVQQMQTNKVAISRAWMDWVTALNGVIKSLRKIFKKAM
ncbi:hypothetical protein [Limnohabitans sp.]|uniref:hypothetical protein n=1 Tax=Limnohabitans sp. TaxID=1907725 RepID=UPI00286F62B6|nr:hypothetical protein [Limnohabitans sp.]